MMTAAVTGANGHIGNNLCRELLLRGYKVKALIRNDVRAIEGLDIEIVKGEITNKNNLSKLFEDVDYVFHLAAIITIDGKDINLIEKVNVQGTRIVTELCLEQNIKRLIHFSSVHALNQYPLNKILTEENPLADEKAYIYDRTKAAGERIVLNACKNGLNAVILNPTSVTGINDFKPSYLGQAFIKIAGGKLPALIPGGFDWVDVRDVVSAAIAAIDNGRAGERYLLPGHWRSLEDLTTEINKYTDRENPIKISSVIAKIGIPFIYAYSKFAGQEPLYTKESLDILKYSNKNISHLKAEQELGYTVRPFSETIKNTVDWFKQNNKI